MKRSTELEAVTRRFWDAFVTHDEEAIRNMATGDADLRFILLAEDEWLIGRDTLKDVMVQRAAEIGAVRVEFDRLEAFENGTTGWAAANITLSRSSGESLSIRNTFVMVIEAGMWRIAQMHSSRGVPNSESFGYEITEGLDNLVSSLDEHSAKALRSASLSGTVTLMFTDIEDSTRKSERLGDDAWSDLLSEHFSSLHHIVERSNGTVVKTLGDGAMVVFPTVKEALTAAIELQQATSAASLRVRIGVHTGDAVHIAGDYVGIAVNKAARIASAASGGEILVSSATAEMAGRRDFQTGPERVGELKGLDGTHRLIPIIWE